MRLLFEKSETCDEWVIKYFRCIIKLNSKTVESLREIVNTFVFTYILRY